MFLHRFEVLLRSRSIKKWLCSLTLFLIVKIIFKLVNISTSLITRLVREGRTWLSLSGLPLALGFRFHFCWRGMTIISLLWRIWTSRLILLEREVVWVLFGLSFHVESKLGIKVHFIILFKHELREATN